MRHTRYFLQFVKCKDNRVTDKTKEMRIATVAENFKSIEKSLIAIWKGIVGKYQERGRVLQRNIKNEKKN